jgi:cysteine desulfurase
MAMGSDEALARGSLRLSLGHTSGPADVDAVVAALGPVVQRARRAGYAGSRQRGPAGSPRRPLGGRQALANAGER